MISANEPSLLAYCIPLPGRSSRLETFLCIGARRRVEWCSRPRKALGLVRERLNHSKAKTLEEIVAGKYELAPDGKCANISNLFENGTRVRVETKPGSSKRKL